MNFSNPTKDDIYTHLFNAKLVSEGYAQSSSYPPDVKYQEYFSRANAEARKKNLGLWKEPKESTTASNSSKNSNTAASSKQTSKKASTKKSNNSNNIAVGIAASSNSTQYVDKNGKGLIKGNINNKGEKIYHLPNQQHYKKTKISPEKGERYFKTEAEAQAAGWRKSKR